MYKYFTDSTQKLEFINTSENRGSATNLARVYWMEKQTTTHTEQTLKLTESVMNCDSGRQEHEKSLYRQMGVALVQWLNEKSAEKTLASGPCVEEVKESNNAGSITEEISSTFRLCQ
jgi:hypothetical protein